MSFAIAAPPPIAGEIHPFAHHWEKEGRVASTNMRSKTSFSKTTRNGLFTRSWAASAVVHQGGSPTTVLWPVGDTVTAIEFARFCDEASLVLK
jgi:hypothetical protein